MLLVQSKKGKCSIPILATILLSISCKGQDTRRTESKPSKINTEKNMYNRYEKHGLLPEQRKLAQKVPSKTNEMVELETQHSQIKIQVAELVQKCEKQKMIQVENLKLIKYTRELERNIMCQYRNRYKISRQLDTMLGHKPEEDSEIKERLLCDIQKKDGISREKIKERDIRLKKKAKGVTQVLHKLKQKIDRQEYLMTCLIEKRMVLSNALSLLNNRKDLIDHNSHKEVEALSHTLQHNADKYQQDIDDGKLAIEQSEQENLKLLTERNQLTETLNKTQTEVERLTEEKKEDVQELEKYVKIKDKLKESAISNNEDIGDRADEIISLYQNIATLRKTLENCEKQVAIHKKESEVVVQEHEKREESLGNLEELTIQCKLEIIDFENKIKKSSREIEVLENLIHLRDSYYEDLENQRLLLKLDAENILDSVKKLREGLMLDVTEYTDLKQKIDEMVKGEIQLEVDAYKTKKLSDLQEQIVKEKENHTTLLRQVELLEQNLMNQNNQLVSFILEKEKLTNKYTDTERNLKEIEFAKGEQDSQIMLLKEEIEQKHNENQSLKTNCTFLEDNIQKHDNNDKTNDTTNKIISTKEESLDLSLKLSLLENTLTEEQMTGKKYKREIEELTRGLTSVEDELIDLIHAKEEKIELETENEELEHKCKVMQSQYTELHNCTEALLSVVRTLKEKSENRSRVTDDPRTFSVTFDSDSSIF